MTFGLLNILMLMGLAAVAIPPIIHLLNRRRYVVIDWGAMQFLKISDAKRRRLLIEEMLLMGLRMLLIAVMVIALAAPFAISPIFSALDLRQNRDVVLVFGGSASMAVNNSHEAAKKWALGFIDDLAPGDRVVILQAKKQVVPVLAEPTSNLELARKAIEDLPAPGGGCDWPRAVQEAHRALEKSTRPLRNIILLGDGQRAGWADPNSLGYWEALADQLPRASDIKPTLWALNFDPRRPALPPSLALAPLRAKRVTAYVKQDIEFQTDLLLLGQSKYEPPRWVHLEIDEDRDQPRKLRFPSRAEVERERPSSGKVPGKGKGAKPLAGGSAEKPEMLVVPLPPFKVQFAKPGSHLVTVVVKPRTGPPQRQNFAVEILALPVLIVDGDPAGTAEDRRIDFLRLAVDPRKDSTKEPPTALIAEIVSADKFDPARLNPPPDKRQSAKDPRVLILANVPRLTILQQKAVAQFLEAGGGVLITLGDHVEKNLKHYNDDLFNKGAGWLPARLEKVVKPGIRRAASPSLDSFNHAALELFRQESPGGLNDAYFPRWWEVTPTGGKNGAATVARLTGKNPFLVERDYKGGKIILCTVPLLNARDNKDTSWDTNLVRLPVFAPLMHELVYYLGGNLSSAEKSSVRVNYNLQPGEPLYYNLDAGDAVEHLTLAAPGEKPRPLVFDGPRRPDAHRAQLKRDPSAPRGSSASKKSLVDFEDTHHTGVYVLRIPRKEAWLPEEIDSFFNGVFAPRRKIYYSVHNAELDEFDLTPLSEEDRDRVSDHVPLNYETDSEDLIATLVNQANTQELWWILMLAVVLLLCSEVWLTRRIVRGR